MEGALRTQFQSRKDEIRNRNLEELTTLKNAMEETMDGLWSSLQVNHDTENIDFNSEIDFSTDRLVG